MSSLEGPRDFFIDDAADFHLENLKGVVGEQLRNHFVKQPGNCFIDPMYFIFMYFNFKEDFC